MTSEGLRAYSVQGYETGCVVFAPSNVVARRNGANELDIPFEGVESCRLAPEFDEFAPGPVPAKALLAAGWWQYCSGCGKQVREDDDEFEDEAETIPAQLVYVGDHSVFCSQSCHDNEMAERAKRKQVHDDMLAYATAKWPGIVVTGSYEFTVPPSMSFTFPGGQYPVRFNAGESHVTVVAVDKEAWDSFAESVKVKGRSTLLGLDRTQRKS